MAKMMEVWLQVTKKLHDTPLMISLLSAHAINQITIIINVFQYEKITKNVMIINNSFNKHATLTQKEIVMATSTKLSIFDAAPLCLVLYNSRHSFSSRKCY